jgi:hypothetical protein
MAGSECKYNERKEVKLTQAGKKRKRRHWIATTVDIFTCILNCFLLNAFCDTGCCLV